MRTRPKLCQEVRRRQRPGVGWTMKLLEEDCQFVASGSKQRLSPRMLSPRMLSPEVILTALSRRRRR